MQELTDIWILVKHLMLSHEILIEKLIQVSLASNNFMQIEYQVKDKKNVTINSCVTRWLDVSSGVTY